MTVHALFLPEVHIYLNLSQTCKGGLNPFFSRMGKIFSAKEQNLHIWFFIGSDYRLKSLHLKISSYIFFFWNEIASFFNVSFNQHLQKAIKRAELAAVDKFICPERLFGLAKVFLGHATKEG